VSAAYAPARAIAIALFVVLSSTRARADDPRLTLHWTLGTSASECASTEAIQAAVRERLGRDPFEPGSSRIVVGHAERDGDRWLASLHLYVGGALVSERSLVSTSADCSALARAVVLVVALAAQPAEGDTPFRDPDDPEASTVRVECAPAITAEAPPPATEAAACPPPPPPVTPRARASMYLSAAGGIDWVPGPWIGIRLGGHGALWDTDLEWSAALTYLPETAAVTDTAAVLFGLTVFHAGVCWAPRISELVSIMGCVNIGLGALHAAVQRPMPIRPGDRFWIGTSIALATELLLVGPLFARLALAAEIPFIRSSFEVTGASQPIFQQLPVIPTAELGLGLRW
jgi:hypothetical protein